MRLRSVITDVLADLHLSQFANKPGTQDEADQKGRQTGVNRPKRDVPENVERRYAGVQRVKEVVQHDLPYRFGLSGWHPVNRPPSALLKN
jgi:hypothetical protein